VTIIPEPTLAKSDKTPYNESRALKIKLDGIMATASTYPNGREVPVHFVSPDFELVNASYPGIYLAYGGVRRAPEREVRGPTNLQYAPPGYPTSVQVPEDFEDKDSVLVDWEETGFDRLSSPYHVPDHPIPYDLEFNISVLTRNYQQAFEIISELQEIDRLPERFGSLEVPEDGTIRTLELLGGPETSVIQDEDGKRLVQTLYSVRVAAELSLFDVEQVRRVGTVNVGLTDMNGNTYL
jgi:hypothetical protein